MALLCGALATTIPAASAQVCGDVDADGNVTATDALATIQAATGTRFCDACLCDPDCNREITASDALAILRAAVGMGEELSCCVIDECFVDEDCPAGYECTGSPIASCDLACVPVDTTTTTTTTTLPDLVAVEDLPEVAATPAGGANVVAAEPDDKGGLFVVWSNLDAAPPLRFRVVARHFDASVGSFGDEIDLTEQSDRFLEPLAACTATDGSLAVAWTEALIGSQLADGTYVDISNVDLRPGVTATAAPGETIQGNDITYGRQAEPVVACLGSGDLVMVWRDSCSAIKRSGISTISFRPDQCDTMPPSGAYMRRFDASGKPTGASERIDAPLDSNPGSPAVEALADGGFVVFAPRIDGSTKEALIRIYDAAGSVTGETTVPGTSLLSHRPDVQCAGNRCIAILDDGDGIVASIFDVDAPSGVEQLRVRDDESLPPPPGYDEALLDVGSPHVACDAAGQCLIVWHEEIWKSEYDAISTTELGEFRRLYDLSEGTLGARALLDPTIGAFDAIAVAAVANGRFAVVAEHDNPSAISGRIYEVRAPQGNQSLRPRTR